MKNIFYVRLLVEARKRLWDGDKANSQSLYQGSQKLFVCSAITAAGKAFSDSGRAERLRQEVQRRLTHARAQRETLDSWACAMTGKSNQELYPRGALDRQLHRQQWIDKLIEEFSHD